MTRWLCFFWSLLGVSGVMIAALIAHFYPPESRYFMTTANQMHFVHLMPLLVIFFRLEKQKSKLLIASLVFFILGYILFPFAIYTKYTFNIILASRLAPYGGYSFSIAWILLGLSFVVKQNKSE